VSDKCQPSPAVVGVGSALFHATLRHIFQAADELPMLYCNLIFVYLMLEEGSGGGCTS
jgi:dihydroceramidase